MSAESTEHALSEEIIDDQDASENGEASLPRASSASRLEEEGDVAADYLEELLDIADIDGDIDIEVRDGEPLTAGTGYQRLPAGAYRPPAEGCRGRRSFSEGKRPAGGTGTDERLRAENRPRCCR